MKPHEKLGIAIANAGYDWTAEMRSAWEELDKEVAKGESKWQTPYGYVMKFESGIEAFNVEEYELPNDKRISSIPLYTHPVKELTDEEIWEVWKEAKNITLHTEGAIIEVVFAKAILRKAQEK